MNCDYGGCKNKATTGGYVPFLGSKVNVYLCEEHKNILESTQSEKGESL